MKIRHIIMIIVLILFATIMFKLKDTKDTKHLVCTTKSEVQGMDSDISLEVSIKNNKVKNMHITIDAVLPSEYEDQKDLIINNIRNEGKMQVTSTDKGIRLTANMQSDYFKSFGLNTNSSYNELKEALEFQGYTCK